MPGSSEAKLEDKREVKWGNKSGIGGKNRDIQCYESFIYDGVEYFLYDCVCSFCAGNLETSVGKLVKICEKPTREKIVKVVWLFRPIEIRCFFGSYRPCWNELFLAYCVLCTSKDKRNPELSEGDLNKGNYFFNCTFDVGRRKIVDKFPDEIDGIKVEYFFNKKKNSNIGNPQHVGASIKQSIERSGLSSKLDQVVKNAPPDGDFSRGIYPGENINVSENSKKGIAVIVDEVPVSNSKSVSKGKFVTKGTTTGPSGSSQHEDKAELRSKGNFLPKRALDSFPYKKRKIFEENSSIRRSRNPSADEDFDGGKRKTSCEVTPQIGQYKVDKTLKTYGKMMEVTGRPEADKRRWFKPTPWDDRLQRAEQMGTLVLLNNLDPSYTSYEVEVEARMIEWSTNFESILRIVLNINQIHCRALVIFRTRDAAVGAMHLLSKRSLILGDGRTVTAMKGSLVDIGKRTTNFIGHLIIDGYRSQTRRLSEDMRNAVSTAHCAQPNTIEYGMALEWLKLQLKSDLWWKALNEKQMKEIENVKRPKGTQVGKLKACVRGG